MRETAVALKGLVDGEKLIGNIYADRLMDSREEPKR